MKPAIITIIVIGFGSVILWVASDTEINHLAEVLPFIGGREVGLYDWAGLAILVITGWGMARLFRRDGDKT